MNSLYLRVVAQFIPLFTTLMADTITITLGDRTFKLDREKAEEAFAAKKVVNGRNSMFFNILPLKYQWAYDLYKEMKNAHWESAEMDLKVDQAQWDRLGDSLQTLYKTFLGAFARSQEICCSGGIYTVRDLLTAPELKLVFGRFVHEENTRNDILVYLHGSLSINPMECCALTMTPEVEAKKAFVTSRLTPLTRHTDTTTTENKQSMVRNIFLANQCMEGTQFVSLWAAIFSLSAQNKTPGTGEILSKLFVDVAFRLSMFDQLVHEMIGENQDLWTPLFRQELVDAMKEAVTLEQSFIASLPVADAGVDPEALSVYVEYLADERLSNFGLPRQYHHAQSPLPWLDEALHLSISQSSTTTTLDTTFDDDDL